jgi:vitamin B12 transporter
LFDLSASFQISNALKIHGRIENLFNQEYEEVLFYGTLDRTFYAGFEVNMNNIF